MTPDVENLVGPTPVVFNQRMLRYYDRLLEFTCNRVWRCPIRRTLELYRRHLSSNHLEVGVGTGYFLNHCRLRDGFHGVVARNRYRWFDKRATGYLPS